MLGSFGDESNYIKILLVVGILVVLLVGLVFFLFRRRKRISPAKKVYSKDDIEDELVYGYGIKLLKRSIKLDGSDAVTMSIGPKALTEHHMKVRKGVNFKFTATPINSKSGERFVNIKCHPPGVLETNGQIKSEVNLYNGEEIIMDGIPVRYENGQTVGHGENILKESV